MIHDLDGGDSSPSRGGAVRAFSVLLAFSALIGWATISSTVFRGPFATPHPSANAAALLPGSGQSGQQLMFLSGQGGTDEQIVHADAGPRYNPMPFVSIDPASVAGGPGAGCVIPGGLTTTYVFVNGAPVTVVRPAPTSASTSCAALYLSWGHGPFAVPPDRMLPSDRVAH